MDTVKISNFILMARTKAGLTQKELADKIGVSDKTISKWETGKSLPDISYYETLCDALNIKVNELLSGEYLVCRPCFVYCSRPFNRSTIKS